MASRSLGVMAFFQLESCLIMSSPLIAKYSQIAPQSFESIGGICQDENVVLERGGGTLQINVFFVKVHAQQHASFSSSILCTNTTLQAPPCLTP
jgi:hypothetical protein